MEEKIIKNGKKYKIIFSFLQCIDLQQDYNNNIEKLFLNIKENISRQSKIKNIIF